MDVYPGLAKTYVYRWRQRIADMSILSVRADGFFPNIEAMCSLGANKEPFYPGTPIAPRAATNECDIAFKEEPPVLSGKITRIEIRTGY